MDPAPGFSPAFVCSSEFYDRQWDPGRYFPWESYVSVIGNGWYHRNADSPSDVSGIFCAGADVSGIDPGCEAAGYLCWKKYHGDLFFPLSDHDRTQRPASSQHPADAECLGAFRSILGACADPWKQAGIFPLRRGTKPAYIYSVQTWEAGAGWRTWGWIWWRWPLWDHTEKKESHWGAGRYSGFRERAGRPYGENKPGWWFSRSGECAG